MALNSGISRSVNPAHWMSGDLWDSFGDILSHSRHFALRMPSRTPDTPGAVMLAMRAPTVWGPMRSILRPASTLGVPSQFTETVGALRATDCGSFMPAIGAFGEKGEDSGEKSSRHGVGAQAGHADPGRRCRPRGGGAAQKVVEAAGAKIEWERRRQVRASSRRASPPASRGYDRVDQKNPRRAERAAGDARGVRREERERHAAQALRDLWQHPSRARVARACARPTRGAGIDLVIVRENVEDLYAGHRAHADPRRGAVPEDHLPKGMREDRAPCLRGGHLRRAAKRVHCATKANIMKLTEGMMKRTFEAVAKEYPQIEAQHIIVDNCAHQLVKKPEQFDVIVTTNMNGDILSDLTSALIGGPGLRAVRQHRRRGGDLRGGPRLGAQVRGEERHQPHRRHPVRGAHAAPHRRDAGRGRGGEGRPLPPWRTECSPATWWGTPGRPPPPPSPMR